MAIGGMIAIALSRCYDWMATNELVVAGSPWLKWVVMMGEKLRWKAGRDFLPSRRQAKRLGKCEGCGR